MILRMKIIRYIFRITCASWLPLLIKPGSKLGWDLGFELGFSVDMVPVAPVGYPLGHYINTLLGLALDNYFGTWEGYLFVVSLGTLDGLMIGTGEVCLVGLSLVLLLGSPPDSQNPGLTGIILEMSLGNNIGSLINYIWNINWCVPRIGTWKLLWHFNWVPSLLFSLFGTCHTDCNAHGIFTWKFSG